VRLPVLATRHLRAGGHTVSLPESSHSQPRFVATPLSDPAGADTVPKLLAVTSAVTRRLLPYVLTHSLDPALELGLRSSTWIRRRAAGLFVGNAVSVRVAYGTAAGRSGAQSYTCMAGRPSLSHHAHGVALFAYADMQERFGAACRNSDGTRNDAVLKIDKASARPALNDGVPIRWAPAGS
jgi:hypothetical protein